MDDGIQKNINKKVSSWVQDKNERTSVMEDKYGKVGDLVLDKTRLKESLGIIYYVSLNQIRIYWFSGPNAEYMEFESFDLDKSYDRGILLELRLARMH